MGKSYKRPNGTGSVIKLSGRRRRPYAVRVSDGIKELADGNYTAAIRYLAYFETRKEALAYLEKYNQGLVAKAPAVDNRVADVPTFAECFALFFDDYKSRHADYADSTAKCYEAAFKNASVLHHRKMPSLTMRDLQDVINATAAKGRSRSTCDNLVKLFHGVVKYSLVNDILTRDISAHLYTAGAKSEGRMPFGNDDLGIICRSDSPIKGVLLTLVYTGMRIGEFLGMRAEDVHTDKGYMVGGSKTKAGKDRIIPIHPSIAPFIDDMLSAGGEWLYCHDSAQKDPVTPQAFRKHAWCRHLPALSLSSEYTPHCTRHTAATLFERFGLDVYRRKLILGHAINDITFGTYTHVTPAQLVSEILKLPDWRELPSALSENW